MKSYTLIQPYLSANRYRILFGLSCLIVVDLLQLFIPRVIKRVVDDLTRLQVDRGGLLDAAMIILALGLCIGIFRFFWRRSLLGTARIVEEALRNRLFSHIQTLSPAYFDRVRTGDLMAHATNDIQQVRMASGMGLVALNDALFLGSAAIGFMMYINLELTLYVLIPMPLIVLGTRFFSRRMHRRYKRVQGAFSELTEAVRERFSGIRVIMAYNAQEAEAREVTRISSAYVNENIDLVKNHRGVFPADAAAHQSESGHRPFPRRPPDHLLPDHPGRFCCLHQLPGTAHLAHDGPGLGDQPDPARPRLP
jgi:ATP-binding cassette subfamily B multidrug efflux pump